MSESENSYFSDDPVGFQRRKFPCTFRGCSSSFAKEWKLNIHYRKHTGERPFICEVTGCNKSYTNVAHLKRHNSLVHEKSEVHICPQDNCQQVLNNKYALKKHINRKHCSKQYPYKCLECSQDFQRKSQLAQHSYEHSGEAPYKCVVCHMGFISKRESNKHKKNHRTYDCNCGETFTKWTILCVHKKEICTWTKTAPESNKNRACAVCKKLFSTETNLRQHQKTHVNETERLIYECSYQNCNRIYYHKKNLAHHVRTYHEGIGGEDVISCNVEGCTTKFKSKKNLNQHLKNIHNRPEIQRKERKLRRDAGVPRKCMASALSGFKVSKDNHVRIMEKVALEMSVEQCHTNAIENNILKQHDRCVVITAEEKHMQILKNCQQSAINSPVNLRDAKELPKQNSGNMEDDILLGQCTEVLEKLKQITGISDMEMNEEINHKSNVQIIVR